MSIRYGRRGFLALGVSAGMAAAGGLAAGAAGAADGAGVSNGAGAAGGSGPAGPPGGRAVRDGAIVLELERLLALERLAEYAFAWIPAHVHLTPQGRSVLRRIQVHERAHRRQIASELQAHRPGRPHAADARPLVTRREADRLLGAIGIDGTLTGAHRTGAALDLLIRIEQVTEAAYLRLLARDDLDGATISLSASILGVEAEHVTLLRLLRRPRDLAEAVPGSFVTGPR